ncbi:HTTM domain-containing protein [Kitasatospora sp. NBC_00315]|uniref:HTTM domain-containing protein n=1 Tax=Kitasatospora sp. NBC_00315 TaxID=2975963 RepID=UPI0032446D60
MFARTLAPYQAAVVRIGVAFTFCAFLLREWPLRRELYGDRTAWSLDLARQMLAGNHAFTLLAWSDSRVWFEFVYTLAIVVGALLLVGWRTRLTSVLFMLLVLSLENRAALLGDGGDNVVHLLAIYLAFTRCGTVWSLDARRVRRHAASGSDPWGAALWLAAGAALAVSWATGVPAPGVLGFGSHSWGLLLWPSWAVTGVHHALRVRRSRGEAAAVSEALANLVHNSAMLVIAVQVCLIYATAGWYKIQGSLWQNGSAVYYPLHLPYFAPWPELAPVLSGNSTLVLLLTYGTVMVQVSFPFLVFNRRIKNVLLILMIAEHIGIAVILGLPFFSLAMITADAVFLPTGFLRRVEALGAACFAGPVRTRPRPDTATAPAP